MTDCMYASADLVKTKKSNVDKTKTRQLLLYVKFPALFNLPIHLHTLKKILFCSVPASYFFLFLPYFSPYSYFFFCSVNNLMWGVSEEYTFPLVLEHCYIFECLLRMKRHVFL